MILNKLLLVGATCSGLAGLFGLYTLPSYVRATDLILGLGWTAASIGTLGLSIVCYFLARNRRYRPD
jgi:hypothetical protein